MLVASAELCLTRAGKEGYRLVFAPFGLIEESTDTFNKADAFKQRKGKFESIHFRVCAESSWEERLALLPCVWWPWQQAVSHCQPDCKFEEEDKSYRASYYPVIDILAGAMLA
jgi:hypothetical protein